MLTDLRQFSRRAVRLLAQPRTTSARRRASSCSRDVSRPSRRSLPAAAAQGPSNGPVQRGASRASSEGCKRLPHRAGPPPRGDCVKCAARSVSGRGRPPLRRPGPRRAADVASRMRCFARGLTSPCSRASETMTVWRLPGRSAHVGPPAKAMSSGLRRVYPVPWRACTVDGPYGRGCQCLPRCPSRHFRTVRSKDAARRLIAEGQQLRCAAWR
jgi:hypothetical protein